MSTPTPYDPSQDADRTILIPNPGRRRRAVAHEPGAGSGPAPASAPAAAPASEVKPPATAAIAGPTLPDFHGSGLNPLLGAANALLDLVVPLRFMPSHPDVEALREQLVVAIGQFEKDARRHNIPTETIAAARYALCSFLDETVASTPWGGGGAWSSRSLLVLFHNEAWGGEKFFMILQRLSQDVRANINVLELMYVCLALGMEGRYRVLDGGRTQLDMLRERLEKLIQKERGRFEADLSPRWHGASGQSKSMLFQIPAWVLAAMAAVIIMILHLWFSLSLNHVSDPVYAAMRRIQIDVAPPVAARTAPLVSAPVRLAGFLAPEIAEGLVSVKETADRSTVTLRGDGVFGSGKAEVERAFMPLLARIGDALQPVPGKVIVIGHTDDTRLSVSNRFASNFDLSKARAAAVLRLLAQRAGPPERYSMEGRGETEPLVPNGSPVSRMRNRRVEIVVLTPAVAP